MNNERPKIIETGSFCLSLDKVRGAFDYCIIIIVILANAVVIKNIIQLLVVGSCSQFSAPSINTICIQQCVDRMYFGNHIYYYQLKNWNEQKTPIKISHYRTDVIKSFICVVRSSHIGTIGPAHLISSYYPARSDKIQFNLMGLCYVNGTHLFKHPTRIIAKLEKNPNPNYVHILNKKEECRFDF